MPNQAILATQVRIVRGPLPEDVRAHPNLISHPAEIPIVLAAMQAKVDHLVMLNRKHFIDDPGVAQQSGLRIGKPGNALSWVRGQVILRINPKVFTVSSNPTLSAEMIISYSSYSHIRMLERYYENRTSVLKLVLDSKIIRRFPMNQVSRGSAKMVAHWVESQ